MRRFLPLLTLLILFISARAEQGMWLPSLISEGRVTDMRAKGFRLMPEDIYAVNRASLKDAIVRFGSGCTGELISDQGLLITNHHCGYGQIQKHSSMERDYLTDGFAAMNRTEELPNEGLAVTFLIEMRDVTDEVLKNGDTPEMVKKNREQVVKKATKGNHYKASVEALYYGNQYFLFVYEVFEDVRLVFAPPSAIGKFGGDTDNWIWPRHTGDFSLFRIYADQNNKPAKYSPDNVPYRPKKSFTISLKGVEQDDFTFVYGFPARTYQYLHSAAVRQVVEASNPFKIEKRTIRLDIMNEAMAKDPAVRIKYAAKHARVSNAWKKWQGEVKGLKRLGTVEKKEAYEQRFEAWAADKPEYRGVTTELGNLYEQIAEPAFSKDLFTEEYWAIEIMSFMKKFAGLTTQELDSEALRQGLLKEVFAFYKDYDLDIDRKITVAIQTYEPIEPLEDIIFSSTSIFTCPDALIDVLKKGTAEQVMTAIFKDNKAMKTVQELVKVERDTDKEYKELNNRITALYKTYMRGMMEMEQSSRDFFPDANSTLRIAYGKADGYKPVDAVRYEVRTTLEGVMEKDNPAIYDYDVPIKLREIYASKGYGRWAIEMNGVKTVPVAFIASNHTTGGNSGSPVLNGKGELIGVNFDRCWEGTMSDIDFDPAMCRNIAIDIRYAMFLIDKVGGAGYLLDEMKFAE